MPRPRLRVPSKLGSINLAALRSPVQSNPRRSAAVGVGVLVLVAVTVVACSTAAPPTPRTDRVTRDSVTTGVTATGSLSALTEQNLGFSKGGQLTQVMVKVGDRVEPGQVLATIDDFALRQTLAQQQAQLASQQAVLNRIVNAPVVSGAQDSLAQARKIQSATEDQADAVQKSDDSAIDRAKKQLDVDKDAQDLAEDQLKAAEAACDASGGSAASSAAGSAALSESATAALNKALQKLQKSQAESGGSSSGSDSDSGSDGDSQSGGSQTGGGSSTLNLTVPSTSSGSSACDQVASAQTAVVSARRQVESSRTAVESARRQKEVDAASNRVSIENARQSVVSAQNTLDSNSSDKPFNIAEQSALVRNADAVVRSAQKDVNDATLRAAVGGTVSAINGAVGEFLSASSSTTALAPGSGAAIPGASLGGATGASGSATTATRPGGSQFLVLDDVNQLQVVLPFEESDAANIAANQKVNVTFDAVPDLVRDGTVVSVAPTGTAIGGVINYYVTVALTNSDPRLKGGQTARATVLTTQLDNVLTVPNAAVRRAGSETSVTVIGGNGEQRQVTFQAGVVGDQRTQVISGLFEGQEIVLPTGP